MRIPLMAPGLGLALSVLALSACDAPLGGGMASMSQVPPMGEYQRHLRDRTARGIPYSIPPEVPGAPLAPALGAGAPLPVTPAPVAATPLPPVTPTAPVVPVPTAPVAATERPAGVAANSFTPVPFGQRPAGAEVPPQGQTQIVTVTDVPTGPASAPNVVTYALSTSHPVGVERYTRRNPLRNLRWESACLTFVSQDAAQEAFLANGGPERDRGNLDPDGDGYACWWDPSVYRRAASAPPVVQGTATE